MTVSLMTFHCMINLWLKLFRELLKEHQLIRRKFSGWSTWDDCSRQLFIFMYMIYWHESSRSVCNVHKRIMSRNLLLRDSCIRHLEELFEAVISHRFAFKCALMLLFQELVPNKVQLPIYSCNFRWRCLQFIHFLITLVLSQLHAN